MIIYIDSKKIKRLSYTRFHKANCSCHFHNVYSTQLCAPFRSSRLEVFCKKCVLEIHTRKHLCQSLFFNKVAGLRSATLFKKRLWHKCFPVNFAKFLRTFFFTEHLRWLFLFFAQFILQHPILRSLFLLLSLTLHKN